MGERISPKYEKTGGSVLRCPEPNESRKGEPDRSRRFEEMEVVNIDKVPKKPLITPLFTGKDMTIQPLVDDEERGYTMSVVGFGKGVRNKFHAHDSDQILIVTAGRGYVATEQEKREVTVGDVVVFPAREKHWHGAVDDSAFSHIFIRPTRGKTTQLED